MYLDFLFPILASGKCKTEQMDPTMGDISESIILRRQQKSKNLSSCVVSSFALGFL